MCWNEKEHEVVVHPQLLYWAGELMSHIFLLSELLRIPQATNLMVRSPIFTLELMQFLGFGTAGLVICVKRIGINRPSRADVF